MNKVVFVKAYFQPVIDEKKWVQTGYSDCKVDGERLAQDIQKAIDELNSDGYEIVSTVPVISGNHKYGSAGATGGYGYGYSYTEGIMIIARKTSS